MEPYDVLMIIVLVGAVIFGFWKGLVWQIASVAAIIVSYFVAYRFREPVAARIGFEAPWNVFIAMLVLYLATSLAIWIAFRFVSDILDKLKLKEFDRQIGALFGFAKGVLLCVVITLFAVALSKDQWRQKIVQSYSGYYIAVFLDKAHPVMPEEVHEVLNPYLHSLDDRLGDPPPLPGLGEGKKKSSDDGNLRDDLKKLFRVGEGQSSGATR